VGSLEGLNAMGGERNEFSHVKIKSHNAAVFRPSCYSRQMYQMGLVKVLGSKNCGVIGDVAVL